VVIQHTEVLTESAPSLFLTVDIMKWEKSLQHHLLRNHEEQLDTFMHLSLTKSLPDYVLWPPLMRHIQAQETKKVVACLTPGAGVAASLYAGCPGFISGLLEAVLVLWNSSIQTRNQGRQHLCLSVMTSPDLHEKQHSTDRSNMFDGNSPKLRPA
jgi:hypothetical protein